MNKYIKNIAIILFASFAFTSCDNSKTVQSLTLASSSITLQVGQSAIIELFIQPISAIPYNSTSWKSSNTNVAQVDNKGTITAVYAGECTITAYCGGKKTSCDVIVEAPNHTIEHKKAYAIVDNNDDNISSKSFILKLLDNNLSLDTTDNSIIGNGIMLNLVINSSWDNELIDTGLYNASQAENPMTFTIGELISQDGNNYAIGSYLGQYTDNGLTPLFAKSGTIEIARDNEQWTIKTFLVGELGEKIATTFSGEILWRNAASQITETLDLSFASSSLSIIGRTDDGTRNIGKLVIACTDNITVSQHIVLPLSTDTIIPNGTYKTSTSQNYFTVISSDETSSLNPFIQGNDEKTTIISGELIIDKNTIAFQYKDEKKRLLRCNIKQ